jgi:PKD repeat protein
MGIRRVTLNNLDKTSGFIGGGTSVSYEDFSCSDSTDLTAGIPYTITVRTNGNPPINTANENVRVWIDYNNDSSFTSNELAFASNDKQVHTGTLTVPGTAISNTPLRMRVAAEWVSASNPIPTPCDDREFSQVEDYKVVVIPNLQAPVTDFTASPTTSCDGVVQFQDLSINGPTSWFWDFGDGFTSPLQNPQHTYTSNDTFDVTLITTNANGSDTLVKNDFIIRTGLNPPAAVCTPITNAYCCGYGVTNFQLQDINNSSSDASVGYEDFTCTDFTHLTEGLSYPVTIAMSTSSPENVKIYLDINANGSFQDPGELLFSADNQNSPINTNIIIPAAQAPYSQALRLRVVSDALGSTFNSCTNLTRGQAEDYTVLIDPNPFPPIANYTDDQVNSCQDTIQFSDNSLNAPFQWFWDFGDGTTDTVQNPLKVYTNPGTYDVKLVVTNANGADSTTRSFTVADGAKAPVCIPNTAANFFPLGIERVVFNTITNVTSAQPGYPGWEDFACDFTTTVTQGQLVQLTVETQSNFTPSDVKAWLDYNNNGSFEPNEEIMDSQGQVVHNQLITISNSPSVVTGTGLRLRIASEFVNAINGPIPCGTLEFGQVEDYTVTINAPQVAPSADFNVSSFTACNGTIEFTDASGFAPTSWFWDFGDGNSSTAQNPTHTYTSVGSFFVELKACNAFGCDSIQKTINITDLTGTRPASCTPTSNAVNQNIGIFNVTLNNMNVSTASSTGYADLSCDKFAELVAGNAYQMDVTVGQFNNQTVEAWIDFNNNGVFTINEKVFSADGFSTLSNVVVLPSTAVKNQLLRMRVMANTTASGGAPFDPCTNVATGEIEDYGVLIRDANVLPVADFTASTEVSCNGEIAFKNESFNNPTSYLWDFGDGAFSIQENPVHRYNSPGFYTVKLRVQNGFGADSLTKLSYINVTNVQNPIEASCYPLTQFSNPDFGIVGVSVAGINNTNSVVDGFENYACTDTAWVKSGQNYAILVNTSPALRANVRVYVDFNDDGEFTDPDELFVISNNRLVNHTGTLQVPANAVKNKILRMRVWCDMATSPLPAGNIPCADPEYGQVEDYGIVVDRVQGLQLVNSDDIRLFPNPAKDRISLVLPIGVEKTQIHMYNNYGVVMKSIESSQSTQTNIPVEDLKSGVYFLKIEGDSFTKTIKFIKE